MFDRVCVSLRNPKILLALIAALSACVVQSGELGSADTMHRLQTAHSFWTSEPPVFPNEYPEFGVHGRGGKLYDWYGIGQPLLLLPFDIAGTYLAKLPVFDDYDGTDPTIRNIFVTYAVNTLISVLTALIAFRFLGLLGFGAAQSVAGVLALLFCTTHLHYTQNTMENNYVCLLTLTGFCFQYEWLRTGCNRALLIGSAAFGLNLLTRLTTALDIFAGAVFLLFVLWFGEAGKRELIRRAISYLKIAAPLYLFFFLADRVYQFYRFGTWTDTYVRYFSLERRLQDPSLPVNYPWTTPFYKGILGPLISPEKSIFLFDPLIGLTVVVIAFAWKRFGPSTKAYVVATWFLLIANICLYARYYEWSGNFAWGDRYVSTAVELACLISVPAFLRFQKDFATPLRVVAMVIIGASFIVQLASLAFWMPLEIYQADDFGHPQFIIALRFKNIVAFALGRMDAWGLNTDSMGYDQWDYQHITCWNFLPFVLRRVGAAANWAVDLTFAAWAAAIGAFAFLMVEVYRYMVEFHHEPEHQK